MITKDALAVHLVTEGNEFLIIHSVLMAVADTVNAVKHFVGLRYPMSDEVESELEDVLYGEDSEKIVTWMVGGILLKFHRTTIVTER